MNNSNPLCAYFINCKLLGLQIAPIVPVTSAKTTSCVPGPYRVVFYLALFISSLRACALYYSHTSAERSNCDRRRKLMFALLPHLVAVRNLGQISVRAAVEGLESRQIQPSYAHHINHQVRSNLTMTWIRDVPPSCLGSRWLQ